MPGTRHPDGSAPHGGPGRPAARAGTRLVTREGNTRGPDVRQGDVRQGDARLPLAVGAATLVGTLSLAVTDPYRAGGHLVCPLLALTGLACPACGAQRAVHSLTHGDLASAWAMNPLLVVLAPVAVVAWARWLSRSGGSGRALAPRRTGGARLSDRARVRVSSASAWVLLVVVLAFGVLRNVPALQPALGP